MQQIGLKRKILREKTEKNLGTKRLNKNEYPTSARAEPAAQVFAHHGIPFVLHTRLAPADAESANPARVWQRAGGIN